MQSFVLNVQLIVILQHFVIYKCQPCSSFVHSFLADFLSETSTSANRCKTLKIFIIFFWLDYFCSFFNCFLYKYQNPVRWNEIVSSNRKNKFNTSYIGGRKSEASHLWHINIMLEFLYCPPQPSGINLIVSISASISHDPFCFCSSVHV